MKEQWPTLTPREYNKLERAGISSCDEFVNLITIHGLYSCGDGSYHMATPDIYIRMAGPSIWSKYLMMLEHINFDWKACLIVPKHLAKTKQQYHYEINHRISNLIELLEEYKTKEKAGK